jgi:hypothetical protein
MGSSIRIIFGGAAAIGSVTAWLRRCGEIVSATLLAGSTLAAGLVEEIRSSNLGHTFAVHLMPSELCATLCNQVCTNRPPNQAL